MEIFVDFLERIALAFDQHGGKAVAPGLDERHGFSPVDLVGLDLIGKEHELIAVNQTADKAADKRQSQRKAGILLHAEGKRDDGNKREARLLERLSQQKNIVGGTAAAACLGDHQGNFMNVIVSALERVDKLSDDQQGGVAGVVVYILQSRLRDFGTCCFQQLRLVAVMDEHVLQDPKVDRRHIGHENRVFALHLLGKQQPPCFFVVL